MRFAFQRLSLYQRPFSKSPDEGLWTVPTCIKSAVQSQRENALHRLMARHHSQKPQRYTSRESLPAPGANEGLPRQELGIRLRPVDGFAGPWSDPKGRAGYIYIEISSRDRLYISDLHTRLTGLSDAHFDTNPSRNIREGISVRDDSCPHDAAQVAPRASTARSTWRYTCAPLWARACTMRQRARRFFFKKRHVKRKRGNSAV